MQRIKNIETKLQTQNQQIRSANENDIDNVQRTQATIQISEDSSTVQIDDITISFDDYLKAINASSMRRRANAVMRFLWSADERTLLLTRYDKRRPNNPIVKTKDYAKIIKICLAL